MEAAREKAIDAHIASNKREHSQNVEENQEKNISEPDEENGHYSSDWDSKSDASQVDVGEQPQPVSGDGDSENPKLRGPLREKNQGWSLRGRGERC